ncbi:MAG: acyltransferase [Bacteroidetes bacterium]|nr:acyltransferase [Bacteroidota bacterium]
MNDKYYIRGFDGLRCISILFVLNEHLKGGNFLKTLFGNDFGGRLFSITSGGMGVGIFFVLSGYLITTLLLKEKIEFGKINYKKFIIRRFFRLFPAFSFYMLITFVVFIIEGRISKHFITGWLIAFFYLYNFVPYGKLRFVEIGHTWSLAVEEQYYLVWPLLMHFFKKNWIFILILFSIVFTQIFKWWYDTLPISTIYQSYRLTIPGIYPILIGCLVAVMSLFSKIYKSNILLPVSVAMYFSPLFPLYQYFHFIPYFSYVIYYLPMMGVGIFIYWLVNNNSHVLINIFEFSILKFIGKLSYSIYLWQEIFLMGAVHGKESWMQKFPQNILCTFIMASFSYFVIEKRFLKMKNKYRLVKNLHD